MHDLVIRGGTIVDGSGGPARSGDVAIDGDCVTQAEGSAPAGRLLRGPQSAQGTRKLVDFQSVKVLAALRR
jgi:hypothetical protein